MRNGKFLSLIGASAVAMSLSSTSQAAIMADVAFVIDQSGSMRDEFRWLADSIATIDATLQAGGVTANYGLAGYERTAGDESLRNKYVDLTPDISQIINGINSDPDLYGSTERGYYAADWARTGFSWSGSDYAKVIVLITDEAADQGSGITEQQLGLNMSSGNFLLNVIAPELLVTQWDEAAYSTPDGYLGFFDLGDLNSDPEGFTADFTAAKLKEIRSVSVPEPSIFALMGLGLMGLGVARRKKA